MTEIGKKRTRRQDPKNQSRYIWPNEVERIYRCQIGERYEKRNIAICKVGFCTGLRISELSLLQVGNCFSEEFKLLGHYGIRADQSKGGYGAGSFFLSKSAKKALSDYMNERLSCANSLGIKVTLASPLFVSQKSSKHKEEPFSEKALGNLAKHMFLKAGVKSDANGKVSSHCFRRTFATEVSKRYSDPKILQTFLRHSSPFMAMRYRATNVLNLNEIIEDVFK